ncbi:hypothetical protein [Synoicihabitans lomoniglobus]|uniref:Uncharacterized protein n=1 Tax=Synoicihabitans lomoniglobus TaxID=2909285 RepID=A0AAE9ZUU3_9BACT|nr:hypothetical protein [Opitutaceae bacterium LMO-M01]WED63746.1 hypothetical protein PXH66_15525 [Opitutaceae bacterium LMO-M01]
MFANFLPFLRRSPPPDSESAFVREVTVTRHEPRSRRSEMLLLGGWILIALKCVGTFWMVRHYAMPFNPWWIVLPTLAAAVLCTWVYWRRN